LPPLFDGPPEIRKERLGIGKAVGRFHVTRVQVVAFSGFIVVTYDADIIDDKREPVLERVIRAAHRLR
jgi:hypothetical protein